MIHVLYNATTYLFGLAESYAPGVPVLWDTAQTKGRPAISYSSSLTLSSPQSSSSHARPLVLRLTRGSHGGPIPTGPGRNRERGNYTPEIPETHQPSDYTIRTDVNACGANFGLFDTNDPIQEFSDGVPYYGNQENIFRIDTAMYAPPAGWSSAPAILNESSPLPSEQSPALGTFIPDWDPRVGGSRPALPSNGLNAHHVDPLPPQAFNTYDDYFYPQPDPFTIAVDVPTSTGYLDGSNSGGTSKRIRGETKCPVCGIHVRRPGVLNDHINSHTGERRECSEVLVYFVMNDQ